MCSSLNAKYPHYISTWIITAKYIASELLIQAKEIWKLKIFIQQLFLFLKVRFFLRLEIIHLLKSILENDMYFPMLLVLIIQKLNGSQIL